MEVQAFCGRGEAGGGVESQSSVLGAMTRDPTDITGSVGIRRV